MIRLALACLALATLFGRPALADVPVRLVLAWADAGQAGAERPAPSAVLQVTNLLADRGLDVVEEQGTADPGTTVLSFTLSDADFAGPYARLRLAMSGMFLPADDSRSDQEIQFAVELVVRRDRLGGEVRIDVPVITSSRKAALMPFMEKPQIAEELPQRFLMAQQWMSLNQAGADAVAAAPGGFALHRLISRALADFALQMAEARSGAVLLIPAVELRDTVALYWASDAEGARQHKAAVAGARTVLWTDLREAEEILKQARRAGVDALAMCAEAQKIVEFFEKNAPPDQDAGTVDRMFPNPGSLAEYLAGRRLDIKFACGRPQI